MVETIVDISIFQEIALNSKVAIFSTSELAISLKNFLLKERKDLDIVAFVDSYAVAEKIDDISVYHPSNIPEYVDVVIIASKANKDVLVSVLEEYNWHKYITLSDKVWNFINFVSYEEYFRFAPPGHFYSPIPTYEDTQKAIQNKISDVDSDIAINYNIEKQLETLEFFSTIKDKYVFSQEKTADNFYFSGDKNIMFGRGSAFSLMGIILKNKPKKIIEVGSGFSTALMYDVNRLYFNNEIKISSIEPYPQRLKSVFDKDYDSLDLRVKNLQQVPLAFFDLLNENDILFIDSSHIAKANSDVNYILFEILPRLKKGVIVHFHDIFFPYEYPRQWYEERRCWNELYMLRAFLSFNSAFKVEFFGNYLMQYMAQKNLKTEFTSSDFGNSIYIRKVM